MLKRISRKYQQWNYWRVNKKIIIRNFNDLKLAIYPGVFDPTNTRTTFIFWEHLKNLDWKEKKVLELGAGSGLISFRLVNAGAKVSASDINSQAIEGLNENSKNQGANIEVIKSSFFENVPNEYDYVLINPPFFPKNPKNETEKAWYCGENLEFFDTLFEQFTKRKSKETILMILSEKAPINAILKRIERNSLIHNLEATMEFKREQHQIIRIKNKH